MRGSRSLLIAVLVVMALSAASPALAAPDGTLTIGVHVTLVSRWLDPAETEALITPFMVLYALHDALVKPMPAGITTPSLAESWTVSKDGTIYEFFLRKGARFHNGDPVTAEDVKFSFERYKGSGAKILKEKVKEVQVAAPNRVRFVLKEQWQEFMSFYGTSATGAGWIVPKKYIEKVGEDGFKKAPVGAGPYKFVSFNPGLELVVEAVPDYWRKAPQVKRIVMRSIPDETTRAAAVRTGEVDLAYLFGGAIAGELRRTPGIKVVAPSTAEDAKGLLHAAIRDPNPVCFMEHKHLYRRIKGEVPEGVFETTMKARVARPGEDLVVIAYGAMVHTALEATDDLEGASIEVLDLRSLVPLD